MKKFMPNRKSAIALRYDGEAEAAPKVIAKGQGLLAEEILQRAATEDIPVHEDPALIELMSHLNINEKIPEELYQAVAEVFAYIYRIDQKMTKTK
ncbi:EscU/YscU/HrcU family type III secretion system export apparatus switch protein [Allobacillus sp. GCM10007491]|uniref:EscU/YscU/HrcU family type III secretion system export apparatus switch protein n=1 Tax=Allobacillus saliphilus TaxID=2912308 RepID=A0A941CUY0_9BACI|nr:EscU/YscU/HrcU family type III secretion system export apparatus switch protein [Allobacillus saliphilus]MBR7552873.1 EscU/YscU/HrcU family type III secretion system export apparatus switch protein [Allobacillus saliphilus]